MRVIYVFDNSDEFDIWICTYCTSHIVMIFMVFVWKVLLYHILVFVCASWNVLCVLLEWIYCGVRIFNNILLYYVFHTEFWRPCIEVWIKYHCVANFKYCSVRFYVLGLYKVIYEFLEINVWCKNWIYLERQFVYYKIMFSV